MAPRLRVRNFFLRLFAILALIAFLSLRSQVEVLFGSHGLTPACVYLDHARAVESWWSAPTLFWVSCNDHALTLAADLGAAIAVALFFQIAPRLCLLAIWILYLSFLTVGSPFLDFQWDNLLVETAFFSLFIAPRSRAEAKRVGPHPVGVFLMQWLLFRLHFESGIAKLVGGDPTWRDLTAMVSYYETAPLPTWIGWYVHQLPEWAHRGSALLTLAVELIAPWFFWAPRRARRIAVAAVIGFQVFVVLTANYTIFNYLSAALCLFILDDLDLRLRYPIPSPALLREKVGVREPVSIFVAGVILVPLTILPFTRFVGETPRAGMPILRAIAPFRTINIYHLFASMTLIRREAVIEGSDDSEHWQPYEFRYKPGDPQRAPAFVAPHQPRVDFQMWFLLLGNRWGAPYFDRLLRLLQEEPQAVASLFASNPFPDRGPRYLRVAIYRYRFTDAQTRRDTGAWWQRELISYSRVRQME